MANSSNRDIHRRLTQLSSTLAAAKVYFRKPDDTNVRWPREAGAPQPKNDRDRILCALLNKAANTHAAILLLCDSGLGDDAYALVRVLCENAVYLTWILRDDWITRLDTYSSFAMKRDARLLYVKQAYYGDSTTDENEAPSWLTDVADAVFGSDRINWAHLPGRHDPVRLEEMLREITPTAVVDVEGTKHPMYDLLYFDASAYVHSTVASLGHILDDLRREPCYRILRYPRLDKSGLALFLANLLMLWSLTSVFRFLMLPAQELSEIIADLKALHPKIRP